MSKPLFVNDKNFVIQVGTPSGAGRMVQPGFAVEGDYFISSVKAGIPLRRLSEREIAAFDKKKILMSLSITDSNMQAEVATPYITEAPKEDFNPNEVKKAPDSVNNSMEETLGQAMREMGTQIPTVAELNKMSIEQLNAFAVRYNISEAGGRADIIKQLKAKLSL